MLDDKATNQGQDQDNKPVDDSAQLREQLNALTKQLELTKNELSSRDSKIGEYQKTLKESQAQMEELRNANLSEAEKQKMELEKLKMDFQQAENKRIEAINKAKALELMADKGIDKRFIDFVPLNNSEAMMEKLESLTAIASDAIQQGAQSVVNKIGSNNIPTGGAPAGGVVTLDQYRQMSVSEQNKVLQEGRLKKA